MRMKMKTSQRRSLWRNRIAKERMLRWLTAMQKKQHRLPSPTPDFQTQNQPARQKVCYEDLFLWRVRGVCVPVCERVYASGCVCVCGRGCMPLGVCACEWEGMCLCACVCVCACMHACVHAYVCVCERVHASVCVWEGVHVSVHVAVCACLVQEKVPLWKEYTHHNCEQKHMMAGVT